MPLPLMVDDSGWVLQVMLWMTPPGVSSACIPAFSLLQQSCDMSTGYKCGADWGASAATGIDFSCALIGQIVAESNV
jgi:hypothetical protein